MRKIILVISTASGACLGVLAALHDSLTTQLVMGGLGVIGGLALGGLLIQSHRRQKKFGWETDSIPGFGMTSADIAANYWRDKGQVPLSSPLKSEHGEHQFEPDKL